MACVCLRAELHSFSGPELNLPVGPAWSPTSFLPPLRTGRCEAACISEVSVSEAVTEPTGPGWEEEVG